MYSLIRRASFVSPLGRLSLPPALGESLLEPLAHGDIYRVSVVRGVVPGVLPPMVSPALRRRLGISEILFFFCEPGGGLFVLRDAYARDLFEGWWDA